MKDKWKSLKMPKDNRNIDELDAPIQNFQFYHSSNVLAYFDLFDQRVDEMLEVAFAYHGYSKDWIKLNSQLVRCRTIDYYDSYHEAVYSVAGEDLFRLIRTTTYEGFEGRTTVEIKHLSINRYCCLA